MPKLPGTVAPPVADVLRDALLEKKVSVRELARRLAGDDPQRVEKERRALYKILTDGQQPGRAQAERIAAALGESPDWLVRERRRVNRVEELEAEIARLREEVSALHERMSQRDVP